MKPKRIKVGFHVRNEGYPDVDLRFPEKGNPGIGGTQFTTVATAYYLNQLYQDQVEVLIFANHIDLFPPSLKAHYASDDVDAALKSDKEGCDVYIFKSRSGIHPIYQVLRQLNVRAIARSNNTPDIAGLNQIANCPAIRCHVCISQEQLDGLRDHRIFEKSTRIFHAFNPENFIPSNDVIKKENTVVFLGNLIHEKGFHHLARVWLDVIDKRPDAKLIVIGSGKLYNRDKPLGKWGIAEEGYEANYIRPFLADKDGNVIESVYFAGLLGEEKIEILQNADVGVVNPSGNTETFCSSALEFQASGTPVVSAAKGGLLDTVAHGKTGLLGRTDKALARNILYLLNNPTIARQFGLNGMNFVREKFSYQVNARNWLDLIRCVCNDEQPQQQPIEQNYFHNSKFLREGIRILRQSAPALKNMPSLSEIKQSF